METSEALLKFLKPYDPKVQQILLDLRAFIVTRVPEANELIWDNYNALAIAYSKSEVLKDAFCHLAIYAKHVNFGFNRGSELSDQGINLEGKGKLIRHIKVRNMESFDSLKIEKLLYEALGISEERNAALVDKRTTGKSIVMSISEKKIRPKSNEK